MKKRQLAHEQSWKHMEINQKHGRSKIKQRACIDRAIDHVIKERESKIKAR